MRNPYDASGARLNKIDEQNEKSRRRACKRESAGSVSLDEAIDMFDQLARDKTQDGSFEASVYRRRLIEIKDEIRLMKQNTGDHLQETGE